MMAKDLPIEKVASISKATIGLVLGAVFCSAISVFFHSKIHALSWVAFVVAVLLGSLAILQLLNSIAFPRPLRLVIHWAHAMAFEIFSLLFIFSFRLLRSLWKKAPEPIGNLKGQPILLVHGYCNDSTVWVYQKKQLAKEGLGPIYTVDLGFPFRSIRDYAKKVAEKAAHIAQETGRKDLILIGHSMGGLVSSFYAFELAPTQTVTDIITIASPLNGTLTAHLGLGPNAREMQRNSELVSALQPKIAREKNIRFYHLATATDQLVLPTSSALVGNDLQRQFVIEDLGHTALLFSPRVSAQLAQWLHRANE